jgi:DNA-binding ferritin-like protein
MRLYEAKKLELSVVNAKRVEEAICSCLCMVTQAHIWHWQTKSYATHKALGEFYDGLQGSVDELAEIFFGAGGSFTFRQHKTTDNFISVDDVAAKVKNFRNELVQAQAELMKDENAPLHSAGDKILEIVQSADKLSYLLTLK